MARLAANLSLLFKELPYLERYRAAAEAGFGGVEALFPYEEAATETIAALSGAGLSLVLMNTPPPNYTGGPRGFAAVPGGEDRFRRDFQRTMRYAQRLKPRHVHIMAGRAQGRVARDTYLRNLAWAAAQAPAQSLLIEPVGSDHLSGYFLSDLQQALDLLGQIGAPNLGLLFDVYQVRDMAEDLLAAWDMARAQVRHVQIAGAADRHEPRTDDVGFRKFCQRLSQDRYDGWIGAEYVPRGRTWDGLDWMKEVSEWTRTPP